MLCLRLMSWPEDVGRMKVECRVKTNYDEKESGYKAEFDASELNVALIALYKNDIYRKELKEDEEVWIEVSARITNLYDLDEEEICMNDWGKYNVL